MKVTQSLCRSHTHLVSYSQAAEAIEEIAACGQETRWGRYGKVLDIEGLGLISKD